MLALDAGCNVTPDTKVKNAATFRIEREDHTVGNTVTLCAPGLRVCALSDSKHSRKLHAGSYTGTLRCSSPATRSRIRWSTTPF